MACRPRPSRPDPYVADDWIRHHSRSRHNKCGLPVVTVPIDALRVRRKTVDAASFRFCDSYCGVATRLDAGQPPAYCRRRIGGDRRFAGVGDALRQLLRALRSAAKDLNIAVPTTRTAPISWIRAHIEPFGPFKHNELLVSSRYLDHWRTPIEDVFPLDVFDVVIVHYTVRVCFDWHMNAQMSSRSLYRLEVLFIQAVRDARSGPRCHERSPLRPSSAAAPVRGLFTRRTASTWTLAKQVDEEPMIDPQSVNSGLLVRRPATSSNRSATRSGDRCGGPPPGDKRCVVEDIEVDDSERSMGRLVSVPASARHRR